MQVPKLVIFYSCVSHELMMNLQSFVTHEYKLSSVLEYSGFSMNQCVGRDSLNELEPRGSDIHTHSCLNMLSDSSVTHVYLQTYVAQASRMLPQLWLIHYDHNLIAWLCHCGRVLRRGCVQRASMFDAPAVRRRAGQGPGNGTVVRVAFKNR